MLKILHARATKLPSYEPPSGEELLAAFHALDKAGSGLVASRKLRNALTNPKDANALKAEEFEELLKQLPSVEGATEGETSVRYAAYCALAARQ